MNIGWKPLFYGGLLPLLAKMPPGLTDGFLSGLGRSSLLWPPRREALRAAASKLRMDVGGDWDDRSIATGLAAGAVRHLSRDFLLDPLTSEDFDRRFDVNNVESLDAALGAGRGVILVGCHFGAHLAGLHWLYRRELPLRLVVQRPSHVSRRFRDAFEGCGDRHPQSELFVTRRMAPSDAANRVLAAWKALRDRMCVYMNCDIPWSAPTARTAHFLGQERRFLALWTDLAAVTGTPAIAVFCVHRPPGRYELYFEGPWNIAAGGEDAALQRYLDRLTEHIAANPADAIPYTLWNYDSGRGEGGARKRHRRADREEVAPRARLGRADVLDEVP